jgi:hypothetical protein
MNLEFVEWMWSASSVDHLRRVQAERGLSDDEFFRQLMDCRVANLRRLEGARLDVTPKKDAAK